VTQETHTKGPLKLKTGCEAAVKSLDKSKSISDTNISMVVDKTYNKALKSSEQKDKAILLSSSSVKNAVVVQDTPLKLPITEEKRSAEVDSPSASSSENTSRGCFKIKRIVVKVVDSEERIVEPDMVIQRLNQHLQNLESKLSSGK
jgi:hypothetical protein